MNLPDAQRRVVAVAIRRVVVVVVNQTQSSEAARKPRATQHLETKSRHKY